MRRQDVLRMTTEDRVDDVVRRILLNALWSEIEAMLRDRAEVFFDWPKSITTATEARHDMLCDSREF
jgi:hypothetical protein